MKRLFLGFAVSFNSPREPSNWRHRATTLGVLAIIAACYVSLEHRPKVSLYFSHLLINVTTAVEKVAAFGHNTAPKWAFKKRAAALDDQAAGKVIRRIQPLEGRKLCWARYRSYQSRLSESRIFWFNGPSIVFVSLQYCYVLQLTNFVAGLLSFVNCGCLVEKRNFKFNFVEVCHSIFWINVKFFIETDVSLALSTNCKTLFRIRRIPTNVTLSFICVLSIGTKTLTKLSSKPSA